MSRLINLFKFQSGTLSYVQPKLVKNFLRACQRNMGVERSQFSQYSTTNVFEPTPKLPRFGKNPNHEDEFKAHPPPEFLKPGEKPDEFEIICYKLHFIRINNLGYKLKLAALYNQATLGRNDQPEPSKNDHYEHAYWTAWKQLGNMNKEEAKKEYIRIGKLRMEERDPDIIIND